MQKIKEPAFLFYPMDYLVVTRRLSKDQKSDFIFLLCVQHFDFEISDKEMFEVIDKDKDKAVLDLFIRTEHNTFYYEPLRKEHLRRISYSETQKQNILKRWNKKNLNKEYDGNTNVKPSNKNGTTDVLQSKHDGNTNDIPYIETETITKTNTLKDKDGMEEKDFIKSSINHLNSILGTSYKESKATSELLLNLKKQGYTLEQIKFVIDNQYRLWKDTKYITGLRPQTLFGEKFETYLNTQNKPKENEYDGFDEILSER